MKIAQHKVVTLDYTLTGDDGNIIDQSQDGNFTYLHGAGNIIPGLERALADKAAGDTLQVSVAPEEAYGARNESLTQVVPRSAFATTDDVQVGGRFRAQAPDGQELIVTVVRIEGDQVTLDGNHPLAGEQLNFDVKVLDVRDATQEEIDHGHVHGAGGHPHE
ncbi:MAG TPA: peptidylprolyl isomerase [Gammaproteobacteria bacterium]|nr:peptidylprolyl isomerase [Gammaproteobacteria bacterium]